MQLNIGIITVYIVTKRHPWSGCCREQLPDRLGTKYLGFTDKICKMSSWMLVQAFKLEPYEHGSLALLVLKKGTDGLDKHGSLANLEKHVYSRSADCMLHCCSHYSSGSSHNTNIKNR